MAGVYNQKVLIDDIDRIVHSSENSHSIRAVLLLTRDRDHAIGMLKKWGTAQNKALHHFTLSSRRRYNPSQMGWDIVGGESSDMTVLLHNAEELTTGGVVIIEDCIAFLRDDSGDFRARITLAQMLSSETKSNGIVLVFLEPPEYESNLPSMIADQFVRMSVPYPRANELEAISREEIIKATHRANIIIDIDRIKIEAMRLATGVVGLTRSAARDALQDALAPDPQDFEAAFQRLQGRKEIQLQRELAMNVLDTSSSEDPIGLDYLTEYLQVIKDKIRITGSGRAKGILLIGPPGTGKTMLARMIGRIVELPVVEFRISSLMNSLPGETERRFSQAFSTLEAMSPNAVLIDEIEKAFGDSSERDGGTMMRCTGSLLS